MFPAVVRYVFLHTFEPGHSRPCNCIHLSDAGKSSMLYVAV